MAHIISVRGKTPKIGKNCFIAETAVLIGDVEMGDNCSIWFGAVLRGDVNSIRLGDKVNVQDNAVIHGTYERHSTTIGNEVSIGHSAIVHGATIEDHALIGMGAIVLDGAIVKTDTIVAAGAVVAGGKELDGNSIYAGVPAKRLKELSAEQSAKTIGTTADHYPMYTTWYREDQTLFDN